MPACLLASPTASTASAATAATAATAASAASAAPAIVFVAKPRPRPRDDVLTFDHWIRAADPMLPSLASKAFSMCGLAGSGKYRAFLFGCTYRMAPVGGKGRKREQRYERLQRAYFRACRNYWCVRRCIVRWRERRMQECGLDSTMASGDALAALPRETLVRLVDGTTKHTFYVRDLIRHFETRLQHSDYFVSEPLSPTNPLTGMRLPFSAVARVVLTAMSPPVSARIPQLLATYWRCGLDMDQFVVRELVMLHELAIRNEAYCGDADSTVTDLGPMYRMAGIPDLCPSLAEAAQLSLISTLVETHKMPLHSFYLATRSWCQYVSAMGEANLRQQCEMAAAEYYRKTSEVRRRAAEEAAIEAELMDIVDAAAPAAHAIPVELHPLLSSALEHSIHPGVLSPSSPPSASPPAAAQQCQPIPPPIPLAELPEEPGSNASMVEIPPDAIDISDLIPGVVQEEESAAAGPVPDLIQAQFEQYEEHMRQVRRRDCYLSEIDDDLAAAVDEWSRNVFTSDSKPLF